MQLHAVSRSVIMCSFCHRRARGSTPAQDDTRRSDHSNTVYAAALFGCKKVANDCVRVFLAQFLARLDALPHMGGTVSPQ